MLGITPGQYRDYAAMRGDASDNLPGVNGIGPKTAAKLLCALGSARAAFDDIAAGGDGVVAAVGAGAMRRLADPDARPAWELNCAAMAMHDDLPLELDSTAGPAACRFLPTRSGPRSPHTSPAGRSSMRCACSAASGPTRHRGPRPSSKSVGPPRGRVARSSCRRCRKK